MTNGSGGSSSGGGGSPPPSGSNTAPTISGSPATAAITGRAWTFTPTATDPNGDRLTFEIQNRPAWATFDTATGRLSGTPTASNIGSFANVVISTTDGTGRASLPAFSINVSAVASGTATVAWTAPTTRSDGTALTNLVGYRIYYGVGPNSFDNVIEVNTVGVMNYVVENLSAGTWYFAVSARDSSGAESGLSSAATKTIS
ncbi:MAG: putative Ig domain-containing protein [Steroidobacteraceae bacterium]|nr:putative Ig domain-containing protein [Steroidobacteraceae bacterium]